MSETEYVSDAQEGGVKKRSKSKTKVSKSKAASGKGVANLKKSAKTATSGKVAKKKAGSKTAHKAKRPATAKKTKKRTFKRVLVDKKGNVKFNKKGQPRTAGRYTGGAPRQASTKAYRQAVKAAKDAGLPKPNGVMMVESTGGRPKSMKPRAFNYNIKHEKLAEPKEVTMAGGVVVVHRNKSHVRKAQLPKDMQAYQLKALAKKKKALKSKGRKPVKKAGSKTSHKATKKSSKKSTKKSTKKPVKKTVKKAVKKAAPKKKTSSGKKPVRKAGSKTASKKTTKK
jgi:hypothetical protein